MNNWFSSAKGKFPYKTLILALCGILVKSYNPNVSTSLLYLLSVTAVLDIGRYIILNYWEGRGGIAEGADERSIAIAHRAGYRAFWFILWAMSMWSWYGPYKGYDWRLGTGLILAGSVVYYAFEEIRGRKVSAEATQ